MLGNGKYLMIFLFFILLNCKNVLNLVFKKLIEIIIFE